jgi:YbbR domain-containing protein
MSNDIRSDSKQSIFRVLCQRFWGAMSRNWKLKLFSLLFAVVIWGALISEDASLTRTKTFTDVPISVTGVETLQHNGLVVVSGLEELQPIRMRAAVPQKVYDAAMPSMYSVRVDVSRINSVGEQTIPIQTSSTLSHGAVEWLSVNEVTVVVDEYITRRRIPVRLSATGQLPEGVYSAGVSADPAHVVISGPRSLVEKVAYVSASYNQGMISQTFGIQYSAVPFRLLGVDGTGVDSKLISVTSENVLLDTLLVERTIYPVKEVPVNLTGITKGRVLDGYEITGITSDPEIIALAGSEMDIAGVNMLDLNTSIDVTGLSETVIRALRVEKPAGTVFLRENSVYVTVSIHPVPDMQGE